MMQIEMMYASKIEESLKRSFLKMNEKENIKMKYIIEESVTTTYFHEVEAESKEEAREKFYDDVDVNYDIEEPVYGDDTYLEIFTKEEWE
jgi:hypothetical protein